MRFLIGAAFAVLLALAFATVALGVITALRMPGLDGERTDPQRTDPEHQDHDPTRRIPV
ncbi:hypothetical protein ABTY61_31060 [Kitasatospora sp. NPDC096128]|uniref:hypothetical protein n=1 Tax=Kitasatospora sp. NPDC096128 TaxID=3155547 RepID=UPI003331D990